MKAHMVRFAQRRALNVHNCSRSWETGGNHTNINKLATDAHSACFCCPAKSNDRNVHIEILPKICTPRR
jgi:hypothetical protein